MTEWLPPPPSLEPQGNSRPLALFYASLRGHRADTHPDVAQALPLVAGTEAKRAAPYDPPT